jgi:hypothetical protein
MDKELREGVLEVFYSGKVIVDMADAILALFASSLVKAQREAFVSGWLESSNDTNWNVHTEATRRYPDA